MNKANKVLLFTSQWHVHIISCLYLYWWINREIIHLVFHDRHITSGLGTFELLGRGWSSLCHFYHITIMNWRLGELHRNTWPLNRKLIVSLTVCGWNMLYVRVKREYLCDVAGGFEVRCSIMLTMQCWQYGAVPRFMYSADREPKSTC